MAYQQQTYLFDAGPLGQIEGLALALGNESAVHYFGGLPYALPPTGEYRFRAQRKLPRGYSYGTVAKPGRFHKSLFDDDCLQLNIWIPPGTAPDGGWPVCVYLHGGFLQWGNANWQPKSLAPLLQDSSFKAILVLPSYRLNAFGFLTSEEFLSEARSNGEPVGNMGMWDQRAALEWVHENISFFGGKQPKSLLPATQLVAILLFSSVTPKTLTEHQSQFNEYITRLGIPHLIEVQGEMNLSEFRVLGDGKFHPRDLMAKVNTGDFGRRMKERNVKLLNGECRDEHTIYRSWRTPENFHASVYARLCAEYPEKLPANSWRTTAALLTSFRLDMMIGRLFLATCTQTSKSTVLSAGSTMRCSEVALSLVLTYYEMVKSWNEGFAGFVQGDKVAWGPSNPKEMRRWRSDGDTDAWEDDGWEQGLDTWGLLKGS
ncbi:Alpha/Beta hydrolase protein [Paramyrothecium foliicola]|nr:Alpha/Beta hydrolase protein [Paramyrothecium foliicola]